MLRDLQQVTGKTWSNASLRRKALLTQLSDAPKQLQRGKNGAFDFIVRQRSRVGNSILDPYDYAAVLKDGSSSADSNLYLFEDEKKHWQLAAVVRVVSKDEKNDVAEIIPSYANPNAELPVATEIRLPTRTLQISATQPYDFDAECPVLP